MDTRDFLLSKDQIRAKYPVGSPDYPTHHATCGCSGCYASWQEWRGGHTAVVAFRAHLQGVAGKAIAHRRRAETDGAACIAYEFVAHQYLDELLAEIVGEGTGEAPFASREVTKQSA